VDIEAARLRLYEDAGTEVIAHRPGPDSECVACRSEWPCASVWLVSRLRILNPKGTK